jgi:hypothetical protein
VADEECPHGLDRAWCSLCKGTETPTGLRRRVPKPAPRTRVRGVDRPAPIESRNPSRGLADLRKVVFHASAYGAWPSIAADGLLTATQLLPQGDLKLRDDDVIVTLDDGRTRTVRDQRPLIRGKLEQHLDGVDLASWLALVNDRVWLFAQQKSLTTMLSRYVPQGGQDVVVFDTAKLLASARGRVEVVTDDLAALQPWANCPCRGLDTFVPIERYRGSATDVAEVVVVGGIPDVTGLVSRVVRYHPDHTTEVLVS